MDAPAQRTGIEAYLIGILKRSEKLSYYARSRGWGFIMTWAHRIAGLILVLYMLFHIYTLSALYEPAAFVSKMKFVDNFIFSFFEWALAVPVIFHALNGTRLILYEAFRIRKDAIMVRWVFVLSSIYILTLAFFMLMGNQQVSAGFFWLMVAITSAISSTIVYKRLWHTQNGILWKLQRVSGAFLLPLVSGHMFFMHLNYQVGHDVETILARISAPGMKALDVAFVCLVFFHAGFGLYTIIGDYIEDSRLRSGLTVLISFILGVFAYAGAKIVLTI
ncbi:MAG: succinate dehydrogenase, hydrophobic membrane anchor protein [Deltaproteobacteria bacterium]|mgnify:CR=1 FL=1|nr:succinate dehydrogenase, hydrophobic membrane anchor protein [Deltaproteobacteria bacterium]MBW2019894.1 succinate dehydrogenase, hydrophobic membrane anchor protein [Deltaproteobacteria bacterium]MBW2074950.1 succinate dehydrogenase, hydrophobic membrane anchor protein [Deltaproteobacteria bacterium]RLB82427.1 MAG: succinate dehydrogenase, hydrophobic membrane anchor protein [Deltaproteobacteria bacterium]